MDVALEPIDPGRCCRGDLISSSGVAFVSDPADDPWTHILCWDGKNWTLQKAGAPSPTILGPQLTADVLKQHLPAGAKLWANLPPPKELAAKLMPADPASAVQIAPIWPARTTR